MSLRCDGQPQKKSVPAPQLSSYVAMYTIMMALSRCISISAPAAVCTNRVSRHRGRSLVINISPVTETQHVVFYEEDCLWVRQ